MKKIILAFVLACLAFPALAGEKQESAFDRVMRTGVIRCGYYVFPPATYRDPKTNELSGLSVDMMNEIGKRAGLKIEWAEEVTFGNWAPALQANRFDVVCTPMFPDMPLARASAFTVPFLYAGLSPLVRADDARFKDNDIARLNKPDVTFIAQDGNATGPLAQAFFPLAKIDSVPGSLDGPTMMQEIVTRKADAIVLDRNAEIQYNKNNPVKLRLVDPAHPLKAQAFALVVRRDEMVLKDFLDNAINDINNDGSIDRMTKKWEPEPGTFLRVAKPYATTK